MGSAPSQWAEKKKKAFILVMQHFCRPFALCTPLRGDLCKYFVPQGKILLSYPWRRSSLCLKWCPCSSGCPHRTKALLMGSTQGASKEDPKWLKTLQHCLAPYFAFSCYVFWRRLTKQGPPLSAHSFLRLGFVGVMDTWLPYVKN